MTWRVYADPIEAFGTSKSIRFKPTANQILDGAFTWIIVNNVSSWTNMKLHLYSDRNTRPGALIVSSTTSYAHADVMETYNNGIKYLGFKFATKTAVNENTYYHLVLSCDGYTYSENSHIAWVKAWPDPIYNQPASYNDLALSSYMYGLIGAEL